MNEKLIASIDILQAHQSKLAKSIAYQTELHQITKDKQLCSKSFMERLSILKTPVSTWKYIGMLDYDSSIRSASIDWVSLSELELVVVSALDLHAFYRVLEWQILHHFA